jgi:deoxycytidine triphosphate deaminase
VGGHRHARGLEHDAAARAHLRRRGIAQFLFFEGNEACETSYADKKGKYQAQQGLTLPRL